MAKFTLDQGRISRLTIQPVWLDHLPRPVAPAAGDPRAVAVLDYLRWCNEQQRLDTLISSRDGEFVVDLG